MGIWTDDRNFRILLYVDEIVMVVEKQIKLKKMLHVYNESLV